MCELFGVNVTVHDIHYSYYIKNSYQITKVMSLSLLLVQWILSTYVCGVAEENYCGYKGFRVRAVNRDKNLNYFLVIYIIKLY